MPLKVANASASERRPLFSYIRKSFCQHDPPPFNGPHSTLVIRPTPSRWLPLWQLLSTYLRVVEFISSRNSSKSMSPLSSSSISFLSWSTSPSEGLSLNKKVIYNLKIGGVFKVSTFFEAKIIWSSNFRVTLSSAFSLECVYLSWDVMVGICGGTYLHSNSFCVQTGRPLLV